MLPKSNRVTNTEFKTYSPSHQRLHTAHMSLAYSAAPEVFKAVVTVSKKVCKEAVRRNELRRTLYDVLANNKPVLKNGIYMVRLKNNANTASKKQLREELQHLIGRVEESR